MLLSLEWIALILSPYFLMGEEYILILFIIKFFLKSLFIYLFMAASGLSCGMWDLCCGMRDVSLRRAGFSSCGAWA